MTEPQWLKRPTVLTLHRLQIEEHGGSHGLRDEGLLDSALARPRQEHAYEPESDLAALAAAYGFGLAKNHAFVDGNKRVPFVTMYVFLGLNGYEIAAPEPEVVTVMESVAAGTMGEADLADWLRAAMQPTG